MQAMQERAQPGAAVMQRQRSTKAVLRTPDGTDSSLIQVTVMVGQDFVEGTTESLDAKKVGRGLPHSSREEWWAESAEEQGGTGWAFCDFVLMPDYAM